MDNLFQLLFNTSFSPYYFFLLLDRPGKPQGPLSVTDVTKNSLHLSWKLPEDDGGEPITYVNQSSTRNYSRSYLVKVVLQLLY